MKHINYKGRGPNGNMLYWTEVGEAGKIQELAVERAAKLGVDEFEAPREDSLQNDWGWVFEPARMKAKEAAERERKAEAERVLELRP